MPLAPEVVFFPPSHCPTLARGHYAAAINLSARPEAAACLAGLEAGLKLGPAALPGGLHVHGFWQLYRTALTQNNHHNAFHWSDLYRLDLESAVRPGQIGHVLPRGAGSGRVALVLGASEAAKRPDALFWARLAVGWPVPGPCRSFWAARPKAHWGRKWPVWHNCRTPIFAAACRLGKWPPSCAAWTSASPRIQAQCTWPTGSACPCSTFPWGRFMPVKPAPPPPVNGFCARP